MNNYNALFSTLSNEHDISNNNNLYFSNLINSILDPSNIPQNYRDILIYNIDPSSNNNNFRIPNRNNINNIIENSFSDKPKYKKVISDDGFKCLKKINFTNNNSKNNSCPIYYIDFEENQEVTILPCNHCFINEAIEKWLLEESHECPVCRYELSFNEVKINKTREHDEDQQEYGDQQEYENQEEYGDQQEYVNNFYNNIQNIVNQIYSTNTNNNVRNNLVDYIDNNQTNNNETNDNQTNNNQINNNFTSRFQNFYNEIENELYSRDLEEAIARSLRDN